MQTIGILFRLKDVSLGTRSPRKSNAPFFFANIVRTEHRSIIIGRSAKPKSVRKSSLYGVFPHRRHFLWRTETRAYSSLGEGGRGFADVNYYWQFHETNLLLALSSVHTRRDVARRGATDSIRRLIAFGLAGFDKRTASRDANQGIGTISESAIIRLYYFLSLNRIVQISSKVGCINCT